MKCPFCGRRMPNDIKICTFCNHLMWEEEDNLSVDESEPEDEVVKIESLQEELSGEDSVRLNETKKKNYSLIAVVASIVVVVGIIFLSNRSALDGIVVNEDGTDTIGWLEEFFEVEESESQSIIHSYDFIQKDCTWYQAHELAIEKGGHLVTFDSLEEYNYVLDKLDQNDLRGNTYFIGGHRKDGNLYYWVDDDLNLIKDKNPLNDGGWTASLWAENEPSFEDGDSAIVEDCMDIFFYQKENRWIWNDVSANILDRASYLKGKIGYIVEYE